MDTVDQAFTKALPKIELHAHLSGSITRECLHEIWVQKKRNPTFQVEDPWILMPPGKVNYDLPTFFQVFSKSIYRLCTDLDSLRYATKSVLSNFQADGVRYLELRTTPRESPEYSISKERYVTEVLDSIDTFKKENPEQMSIYLILSVDRTNTAAQAMEVVDLALKYKARGILAVDLCGDPSKGDVSIFKDAFAKAKLNGLNLTFHFAETSVSGSIVELETLLSFDPDRLGHVIHVPLEIKAEVVRRRLGLELCISCNVLAELTPRGFPEHHFGYWRHSDCPIALCTDDMGFFCSPVSNEYLLAAEHFRLSPGDILGLCERAVDSIFGGPEEKYRLRSLLLKFRQEILTTVNQ
ncbi:hypothetical protein V8E54_004575 [Elaphomyces granulatus]